MLKFNFFLLYVINNTRHMKHKFFKITPLIVNYMHASQKKQRIIMKAEKTVFFDLQSS